MEYTIKELATLAGVSTRTLRYYDQIDLLKPKKINESGYRIYSDNEIDQLQEILFYRKFNIELNEIKMIVSNKEYDPLETLNKHLKTLIQEKEEMSLLIETLEKTINYRKGACKMTDIEKFEKLKEQLIEENENNYGEEIRSKYGDEAIDSSNKIIGNMSREKYENAEELKLLLEKSLKKAFELGDCKSKEAQNACEIHKNWLKIYYDGYTKEYHKSLGEMYVNDPRFKSNYEKLGMGCTEFFRDAINVYCK